MTGSHQRTTNLINDDIQTSSQSARNHTEPTSDCERVHMQSSTTRRKRDGEYRARYRTIVRPQLQACALRGRVPADAVGGHRYEHSTLRRTHMPGSINLLRIGSPSPNQRFFGLGFGHRHPHPPTRTRTIASEVQQAQQGVSRAARAPAHGGMRRCIIHSCPTNPFHSVGTTREHQHHGPTHGWTRGLCHMVRFDSWHVVDSGHTVHTHTRTRTRNRHRYRHKPLTTGRC